MSSLNNFDLDGLTKRLDQFELETFSHLSLSELEWVLLDFVGSWGQRLRLNPNDWPSETQREKDATQGAIILFPFSFASDFKSVNSEQTCIIGLGAAIMGLYIMLIDVIVDEPDTVSADAKLAITPLIMHYYRLMHRVFPLDSIFWNKTADLLNLTFRTMRDEQTLHSNTVNPYSFDEFKRIACDKMAFNQISCYALSLLNNDSQERIDALSTCFNMLGFSLVVRDDARDWRLDYINRNYTYLLIRLLYSEFKEDIEKNNLPGTDAIGVALFCSDLIESLYELVITQLDHIEHLAYNVSCPNLAIAIWKNRELITTLSEKMFNNKLNAVINMTSN